MTLPFKIKFAEPKQLLSGISKIPEIKRLVYTLHENTISTSGKGLIKVIWFQHINKCASGLAGI